MASIDDVINRFLFPYRANENGVDSRFDLDYQNNLSQFNNSPTAAASAEASLIYVCPPVYRATTDLTTFLNLCMPLGAIQNFNLSEARQEIMVKEVGSRLPRKVSGAPQCGVTLSRMLTRHSNLAGALYSWLMQMTEFTNLTLKAKPYANDNQNQWIGFESEAYGIPFGLIEVKVSAGSEPISTSIIEFCGLLNKGTSVNAGSILIMDNASISVGRVKPFVGADNYTAISSFSTKGIAAKASIAA